MSFLRFRLNFRIKILFPTLYRQFGGSLRKSGELPFYRLWRPALNT